MPSKPAPSFTGVWPILVTPFDDKENLDLESLDRVVRFMAQIKMDGVTILGVLGESNRMADHEREQVITTSVKAAGSMPVCVGTSHSGTAAARYLSQMAEQLGAAAVMVTPHHEPTPNEARVFEYFKAIADGITIPIVAQDHPASSQVHMSVPLILRLINEIPRIACVKEEAPPTPQKVAAVMAGMTSRKVTLLQGLGALYGIFDLERGAHGFMTGFAFPEALAAMVNAAKGENLTEARRIYNRFLPLIVYEQQPGTAIRKEVYRLRGLIKHNRVRHPGGSIDAATAGQLKALVESTLPGVDITRPVTA
ncbi:MAG TPA: dihydrodipicolinate synthase family protein [bacterium]